VSAETREVELDGKIVHGEPGDLILTPRGRWHAFWNAEDTRRGSSRSSHPADSRPTSPDSRHCSSRQPARAAALTSLAVEHGLKLDPASIPELAARHGLRMP
jgi:hypothetical protein